MNVAVCLYGLFNNRHSSISGFEGYAEIRRLVAAHPDYKFSFYIFSTDTKEEQAIRHLYEPLGAKIVIQRQNDFSKVLEEFEIDLTPFEIPSGFRSFENLLSFYYSRGKSIDLMLEDASDTKFDWVIVSRFDSGQLDRHNGRQRAKVAPLGFNRFLQRGFLYSAAWDQHNIGYADQWFVGTMAQVKVLGSMYEHALTYLRPGSGYLETIVNGIQDSNSQDEFSNERLKEGSNKSTNRLKLPLRSALNGHLMHKYFFIEAGLYDQSRFSLDFPELALVVYSHSDYFDCMKLMNASVDEHLNAFRARYLISDQVGEWGRLGYTFAPYLESSSYVDRLIQGLVQIDEEFIFFNHEDFPLLSEPNQRHMLDAIELVKSGKLDYFTFARGGMQVGRPILGRKSTSKFLNWLSPWIFSIQPSIWRREKLLSLLEKHRGQGIWEFEAGAQSTFRALGLKGGFTNVKGKKRGSLHWDNPHYPYVATAIVKGKWNLSEYKTELLELLEESQLEPSQRGTNEPPASFLGPVRG